MSQRTENTMGVGRRPAIPFNVIGRRRPPANPTIGEGCPCCGAAISAAKPFVDLNTNRLVYGNKSVHLGKIEAAIVDKLCRRAPGTVDRDSIILHTWTDEPEDAHAVLKSTMNRIRRKLDLIGVTIESVYGVGYRVVLS